jgi:hypothetical protein
VVKDKSKLGQKTLTLHVWNWFNNVKVLGREQKEQRKWALVEYPTFGAVKNSGMK